MAGETFDSDLFNLDQPWAGEQIQSQTFDELLEAFHETDEKPESPISELGSAEPLQWDEQSFLWGSPATVLKEPMWPNSTDIMATPDALSEDSAASHTLVKLENIQTTPTSDTSLCDAGDMPTDDNPLYHAPSPLVNPVADPNMAELMGSYGLTDIQLTEFSLKQLEKTCRGKNDQFSRLKQYRRTCLNRHYARNSRTKKQTESESMQSRLSRTQQEMKALQEELSETQAANKALIFENELLKSLMVKKELD